MSLTGIVAKNTFIQTTGRLIGSAFSLVAIALTARYLGTGGFGNYTTSVAFLQIFGILADLGLTLITVQIISEKDAPLKKNLDNIFTFRFLTALIFLGVAPAIAIFFPYPGIVKLGILAGAAAFFFNSINQVLIGLFQKELKMNRVAIAETANRFLFLILTSLAVFLKLNPATFLLAMSAGNFLNFLLLYIYARKITAISFDFDFSIWKKIIRRSWPIAAGIALNLIYLRADIFILSLLKPARDVGLYGAPYKILDFLTALPYIFMGLALPILTFAWSENNLERFKKAAQKSFDALMILATPMVIGGIILSQELMVAFAGKEFTGSGGVFKILLIALAAIFPTTFFTHAVIAINKQKIMLFGFGASAILSLAGYLIFIPPYSYVGAAWVTVFSECLVLFWSVAVVWHYAKFFPSLKVASRALAAGILMGWFIWAFPVKNIFILVPASAAVYSAFLFITKGIDIKMIREVISLK